MPVPERFARNSPSLSTSYRKCRFETTWFYQHFKPDRRKLDARLTRRSLSANSTWNTIQLPILGVSSTISVHRGRPYLQANKTGTSKITLLLYWSTTFKRKANWTPISVIFYTTGRIVIYIWLSKLLHACFPPLIKMQHKRPTKGNRRCLKAVLRYTFWRETGETKRTLMWKFWVYLK